MTITAYIIENGNFVRSETLENHDPSDAELIQLLGGNASDMAAITMGTIRSAEVNFVNSQPNRRLVIGKAPYIDAHPKERPDLKLSKEQAENLVKNVEDLWNHYGWL